MNPEDKRSLIQQLGFGEVDAAGRMRAGCGYYTGYCGDGANDVGALKGERREGVEGGACKRSKQGSVSTLSSR